MMYHSSSIFSFIPLWDLLQVTWPALSTEQLTLIDQPPQCYSPVDRASLFPRSRFTSESFVKFLMCSYGGGGGDWLGSRELVFSNHDLSISVELAGNFAIRTVQPSITGMKAGWILAVRMVSSHEFLMRTQGEIGPGNLASAVNQVCVKKP